MSATIPDHPEPTERIPRRVDSRVVGALILASVGALVWLVVQRAAPWTAGLPVTVPYFAAILAGLGLVLLLSLRLAVVLLLGLGLAWRFVVGPLWTVLGGVLSSRVDGRLVGGGDLLWTYTPILVVTASLALAAWRRPPGRTPDGHPIQATRVVTRLALPAIVLGPLVGFIAWLWLASRDVYGRPLGVGLLVGGLGLLLFIAYSGFYRLVGRPVLAAVLAAVWSVAVIGLFLLA
jgi:hypothetical protein